MNKDWAIGWIPLGVTADVAPGAVVRRRTGGVTLALVNTGEAIAAFADACPRCDRVLSDGCLQSGELQCAGCGGRFPVTGEEGESAPPAFSIMVVDEEIFALLDDHPDSSDT